MQLFLILQNFQCYFLLDLVIITLKYDTKSTLPKSFQDFISIVKVIIHLKQVVALVVIITMIKHFVFILRDGLISLSETYEIDGVKLSDLFPLIRGKMIAVELQGIIRVHWECLAGT